MSESSVTLAECLAEMSELLTDAAAVAKAAVTCAESGSEHEAIRIAMNLDEVVHEAMTLHGVMRLINRRSEHPASA